MGLELDDVVFRATVFTTNRRSATDGRTTRHRGYELIRRFRKRVEEVFGRMKTVGLMRKTRHRDTDRVGWRGSGR